MKMYASCPICGHKLCKGENGSEVDILCSRSVERCVEFISPITKYELYQLNDTKQQNKQNSLKRPLTGKPHSGYLFNRYYC